jgi:hypothetical protein
MMMMMMVDIVMVSVIVAVRADSVEELFEFLATARDHWLAYVGAHHGRQASLAHARAYGLGWRGRLLQGGELLVLKRGVALQAARFEFTLH